MPPLSIGEELEPFEDGLSGHPPGRPRLRVDEFTLEGREAALGQGVVVASPTRLIKGMIPRTARTCCYVVALH